MKPLLVMVALAVSACEGQEKDSSTVAPPTAPASALPEEARITKPPAVIPKPGNQADLYRMILAGFTPHADHLHPPGVNECPLSKSTDVVM
jgi:hypothetical protein